MTRRALQRCSGWVAQQRYGTSRLGFQPAISATSAIAALSVSSGPSTRRHVQSSSFGVKRLGLGSTKWNQLQGPFVPSSGNSTGTFGNGAVGTGTGSSWNAADATSTAASTDSTSTATAPPSVYDVIVQAALEHGISTIEAGLEGGDAALVQAIRRFASFHNRNVPPLDILVRIGYRTDERPRFSNDICVSSHDAVPSNEAISKDDPHVWHTLSPDYIRHAVTTSPLLALSREYPHAIRLIVLLHNPEVQSQSNDGQSSSSLETLLTDAFVTLQDLCQPSLDAPPVNAHSPPFIDGFGITSNGLSLPVHHPLHLSWSTVLTAAHAAAAATASSDFLFRVVQLPMNALETNGLTVACQIQQSKLTHDCVSRVAVHGLRPLSCYPDGGTQRVASKSTNAATVTHPFRLVDYKVSESDSIDTVWTHTLSMCPTVYDVAFRHVMSHLDASDVLETKSVDELDDDERETLQACRLLQSLLHDVDAHLASARSLAAHDDYVLRHLIPTLHATFDAYDDETASLLAAYFAAVSTAAQYHVATNTRHLLWYGEDTSRDEPLTTTLAAPTYSPRLVPPTQRLQDFGLEFVLSQTLNATTDSLNSIPAFDKIVVGASHPDQVVDTVEIVRRHHA